MHYCTSPATPCPVKKGKNGCINEQIWKVTFQKSNTIQATFEKFLSQVLESLEQLVAEGNREYNPGKCLINNGFHTTKKHPSAPVAGFPTESRC